MAMTMQEEELQAATKNEQWTSEFYEPE